MRQQLVEIDGIANNAEAADVRQHHRRDGAHRPVAGPRRRRVLQHDRRQHQRQPGSDPARDVAEACRAQRRHRAQRQAVRPREVAVRPARRRWAWMPKSKRLLERYHTDFVRAGAQLSRCRQGQAQGDECRARHAVHHLQPEPAEGNQRLGRRRRQAASELAGMSDEQASPPPPKRPRRASWTASTSWRCMNTTGQPPEAVADRTAPCASACTKASHRPRQPRRRVRQHATSSSRSPSCAPRRADAARLPEPCRLRAGRRDREDHRPRSTSCSSDLAPAAVANAKQEAADMQAMIDAEKGGFKLGAVGLGLLHREGAQGALQLRRDRSSSPTSKWTTCCRTACSTPPTSCTA